MSKQRSRSLLLLLGALLAACSSARPIGLAAQRNSTILISVGGESSEYKLGYHSQLKSDWQRGQVVFYLILSDSDPNTPGQQKDPECNVSYGDFAVPACTKFELITRWMTRVLPDAASMTGFTYGLNAQPIGAAIAVVDIPDDPALSPGIYKVFVMHRPNPGVPATQSPALYEHITPPTDLREFTILPGVGQPTPSQVLVSLLSYDATSGMRDLVPYPSLLIFFSAPGFMGNNYPAAAELELQYPAAVIIRNVFEWGSLGRNSLVRWSDDAGNHRLKIHFVSPDQLIKGLHISFELVNNSAAGRVEPTAFTLNPNLQRVYRSDGFAPPEQTASPVASIYGEIR